MFTNKKLILENRFKLLKLVREFFWQKGFLEVETPQIVASPDMEPTLAPLETTVLNEKAKISRRP
jgi:elongation factor P--beta-lysine ligase